MNRKSRSNVPSRTSRRSQLTFTSDRRENQTSSSHTSHTEDSHENVTMATEQHGDMETIEEDEVRLQSEDEVDMAIKPKEKEKRHMMQCPLCQRYFDTKEIEAHAAECEGVTSSGDVNLNDIEEAHSDEAEEVLSGPTEPHSVDKTRLMLSDSDEDIFNSPAPTNKRKSDEHIPSLPAKMARPNRVQTKSKTLATSEVEHSQSDCAQTLRTSARQNSQDKDARYHTLEEDPQGDEETLDIREGSQDTIIEGSSLRDRLGEGTRSLGSQHGEGMRSLGSQQGEATKSLGSQESPSSARSSPLIKPEDFGSVCDMKCKKLVNKFRKKIKFCDMSPYFAPEGTDPKVYMKVILSYFTCYQAVLMNMQTKLFRRKEWGKPVTVGRHKAKTLEEKIGSSDEENEPEERSATTSRPMDSPSRRLRRPLRSCRRASVATKTVCYVEELSDDDDFVTLGKDYGKTSKRDPYDFSDKTPVLQKDKRNSVENKDEEEVVMDIDEESNDITPYQIPQSQNDLDLQSQNSQRSVEGQNSQTSVSVKVEEVKVGTKKRLNDKKEPKPVAEKSKNSRSSASKLSTKSKKSAHKPSVSVDDLLNFRPLKKTGKRKLYSSADKLMESAEDQSDYDDFFANGSQKCKMRKDNDGKQADKMRSDSPQFDLGFDSQIQDTETQDVSERQQTLVMDSQKSNTNTNLSSYAPGLDDKSCVPDNHSSEDKKKTNAAGSGEAKESLVGRIMRRLPVQLQKFRISPQVSKQLRDVTKLAAERTTKLKNETKPPAPVVSVEKDQTKVSEVKKLKVGTLLIHSDSEDSDKDVMKENAVNKQAKPISVSQVTARSPLRSHTAAGRSARGNKSGHNRDNVIKKLEARKKTQCPLCQEFFDLDEIEAHAAECEGAPSSGDMNLDKTPEKHTEMSEMAPVGHVDNKSSAGKTQADLKQYGKQRLIHRSYDQFTQLFEQSDSQAVFDDEKSSGSQSASGNVEVEDAGVESQKNHETHKEDQKKNCYLCDRECENEAAYVAHVDSCYKEALQLQQEHDLTLSAASSPDRGHGDHDSERTTRSRSHKNVLRKTKF